MSEHGGKMHAPLPASSAERLALCPGSRAAEAAVPERAESSYAKRGTLAHHILLDIALPRGLRNAVEAWTQSDPGMFAYAGVTEFDKEICDGVQEALDWVYDILDTYPDAQMLTEQRLHFPSSYAPDDAWGTTDILIYIPSLAWLIVADYKNGVGVVEVDENRQLLRYGVSAALNSVTAAVHTMRLVVIQPNAFHPRGPIRYWDLSFDDILAWQFRLDEEIAASLAHDAPRIPGEAQCKYCNAATTCPALEAKALSVIGTTYASVKDVARTQMPRPADMPVDRLAYILDAKDMLTGWLSEVEKHAYELARQGYYIPGRKLVEAQAKRRWFSTPEDTAQQLMGLSGCTIDEVMPRKLIGVGDAEDLVVKAYKAKVGRGQKKQAAEDARQAMAFLTLKESSGNLSLVPVTDNRPAVNLTAAAFGNVTLPGA